MGFWIDDFEGERPDVEDVDTDRLHEIRKLVVESINDPHGLTPRSVWENQLDTIDEELEFRKKAEKT